MSRTASTKQSGGKTVYLVEELSDARLRCAQLKAYIKEATDLIEESEERDHLFEVAAHLIHGIPDTLFKLEKGLDAAAMAAARFDYEEIKQTLKPEKADELEDMFDDVRLRMLQRRSQETPPMTPKQAAEQLLAIADETEATGTVPVSEVMTLLAAIEDGPTTRTASSVKTTADAFRMWANAMKTNPKREELAARLRYVLAGHLTPTSAQIAASIYQTANSREQVMKGFGKANPHMTDEQLEKAADMWEKHKDVVKGKHAATEVLKCDMKDDCKEPITHIDNKGWTYCTKHGQSRKTNGTPCRKMTQAEVKKLESGGTIKYAAEDVTAYPKNLSVSDNTVGGEAVSKFEKGKPADPTKGMSPEDAEEWEKNTEEHKDDFKAATPAIAAPVQPVAKFEKNTPADPTKQMSPEDAAEWKKNTEEHKDDFKAASPVAPVAKFEEGKPADPTKQMSPEDAAEWKKQNDEHKDNFKAASAWKV